MANSDEIDEYMNEELFNINLLILLADLDIQSDLI